MRSTKMYYAVKLLIHPRLRSCKTTVHLKTGWGRSQALCRVELSGIGHNFHVEPKQIWFDAFFDVNFLLKWTNYLILFIFLCLNVLYILPTINILFSSVHSFLNKRVCFASLYLNINTKDTGFNFTLAGGIWSRTQMGLVSSFLAWNRPGRQVRRWEQVLLSPSQSSPLSSHLLSNALCYPSFFPSFCCT